ncbi:oligosaccharide amylase [Actinomadura rubteroloni]|uniref:Oligosaccharide amylase n=1 Tax=Actinomadura rubteroloni TaxID=1926885 RepID=A0A2P4UQ70_9ACTN|nr:glycoside hydrolase family 15 [Actinomadura rubteroloni]POM27197.1 oligosaccharide amylase [Actinomadura rubteroloni]
MTRRGVRVRRIGAFLLAGALAATCGAGVLPDAGTPSWASPGLVGGGGWPYAGVPLPPEDAAGASYIPGSSVVRLAHGRARLVPFGGETAVTLDASDPRVLTAVRSDRAWLASGRVPAGFPDMASRALLDLRLLTGAQGASLASWFGAWRYAWPRDSAFAAAAFTVTGHPQEALRILRFMAGVQAPSGLWAARYRPDGSPVLDGRSPQLDSVGWMLWAAWLFQRSDPSGTELWPMVRRGADRLAASLRRDGLPPPSGDYWERDPGTEQDPDDPTLGVAGPVLAGLRSAAAFAAGTGHAAQAAAWRTAAGRVADAIGTRFAPLGYPRSPVRGGAMDTSVTFVAPPFAPADPFVAAAVATAARRQALPNGGVLPGERWPGDPSVAWTPETALFALSDAASGRRDAAVAQLGWLASHRTSLGALPEKVDPGGRQAAVAPLGWTASLAVLALSALERPLPVPG